MSDEQKTVASSAGLGGDDAMSCGGAVMTEPVEVTFGVPLPTQEPLPYSRILDVDMEKLFPSFTERNEQHLRDLARLRVDHMRGHILKAKWRRSFLNKKRRKA